MVLRLPDSWAVGVGSLDCRMDGCVDFLRYGALIKIQN